MDNVGISLGWNCYSAIWGVRNNIRTKKAEGYKTCPFDECISDIDGILLCLEDDFAHFMDVEIREAPYSTGGIQKGDNMVYNPRYNIIFNHESPDHVELYKTQNWSGGKNHFVDNNFAEFRKRYDDRINSVRLYLEDPKNHIKFLVSHPSNDIEWVRTKIRNIYPSLSFEVIRLEPPESKTFIDEHLQLMK